MNEAQLKLKITTLEDEIKNMYKKLVDRGLLDVYNGPALKHCKDCDTLKAHSEFGKNEGTTGKQLQAYCKPCMSSRVKSYKKKLVLVKTGEAA